LRNGHEAASIGIAAAPSVCDPSPQREAKAVSSASEELSAGRGEGAEPGVRRAVRDRVAIHARNPGHVGTVKSSQLVFRGVEAKSGTQAARFDVDVVVHDQFDEPTLKGDIDMQLKGTLFLDVATGMRVALDLGADVTGVARSGAVTADIKGKLTVAMTASTKAK
jgi:hypothetical protein